jgi:hypothetical protein
MGGKGMSIIFISVVNEDLCTASPVFDTSLAVLDWTGLD